MRFRCLFQFIYFLYTVFQSNSNKIEPKLPYRPTSAIFSAYLVLLILSFVTVFSYDWTWYNFINVAEKLSVSKNLN